MSRYMTRSSSVALAVTLMLWLGAAHAFAQTGMLRGTVVDSDGNPIPGAKITVTSEQLSSYNQTFTANKKGKFTVRFQSAQLQYEFDVLVEAPGYQSVIVGTRPSATKQMKEEYVLEAAQAEATESMGDLGSVISGSSNAAIEAFNAGLTAQQGGDLKTAKAKFQEALEADPTLGPGHVALAQVLLDLKEYDAALAAADKALEFPVTRADVLQVKFQALRGLDRGAEADAILAELQNAEEAEVAARRVYNEGGQAFQAGDKDTALAKFQEAAKLNPSLKDAHHAVATLLLEKGQDAEAATAAETALSLGSDNIDTLRVLYSAYDNMGKTAELMEIAPRLAAVDPDFGGGKLLEQAGHLWNGGQAEQSVALARQALAIDPSLAKAYYYIGLQELSKGNNAEAKSALEKFIAEAPDDSEAGSAKEMLAYIQ